MQTSWEIFEKEWPWTIASVFALGYMHLADNQRSISEQLIHKPLTTSFGLEGCFGTPLSHLKPLKVRQPNLRGCHCIVFQNRYWILTSHLGYFQSVGESEVASNFDPHGKISESGWKKYFSISTVKLYIYYQLRLDAIFAKRLFGRRESLFKIMFFALTSF